MAYVQDRLTNAQVATMQAGLDGFNPLKAIGRALGASGRALVAAIPVVGPAATSVLNVAAKMPADTKSTASGVPTAAPTADSLVQPSVGAAMTAAQSDALLQATLAKLASAPAAAPQQPQVIYAPSQPSYSPQSAPAGAMPPWMLPAMIGGAALLLVMSKGK